MGSTAREVGRPGAVALLVGLIGGAPMLARQPAGSPHRWAVAVYAGLGDGGLVETVRGWLARPAEPAAIAVLSRQGQDRIRQALQEAGIAVEVLTRDGPGNPGSVKIAAMHRAKGTEFSCVAVVGAEAGVVPLSWLVDEYPEPERPAALGRERSLFYVSCSRARDELVVSWSGSPSPLLPERHST